MRRIIGFCIILLLIPSLYLLCSLTLNEVTKAKSLNQVLDTKVKIDDSAFPYTSTITDSKGRIIKEIYKTQNRRFINYADIPQILKDIYLVSEDQQFYFHKGFDLSAIGRALIINTKNGAIQQGGSTITQQLARNLYLTNERTYNRKITELLYAYQLERDMTKDQLLNNYVNTIYYANGAYGIEAAAHFYFSKTTKQLSKGELSFLAAIPNNPSLYDPLTNFENTRKRQERLLQQLEKQQLLTQKEKEQILKETITFKLSKRLEKFPDYTDYTLAELRQLVANQEGYRFSGLSEQEADELTKKLDHQIKVLLNSGITIHTYLDSDIQKRAKSAVSNILSNKDVEVSAVVINHSTHELVSMIGGKTYKASTFNRAHQSFRQPGSTIKPLLVYAPYLERAENDSINQTIDASPICIDTYCPQNYGDSIYGTIPLSQAMAKSVNTASVRLLQKTGIKDSFFYLDKFNFKKTSPSDRTYTAAVGGFKYGMSVLELTRAYTTFMSDGDYMEAHAIKQVTDRNGKILYKWDLEKENIWSKNTADKMQKMLTEVVTNGTAKSAYMNKAYIGGKTGTTNDYHDLWFIGMTASYTGGVWVGKDQPTSIEFLNKSQPQIQIWKSMMSPLY